MNCERAKELFSELHEGTIGAALGQAAERHLYECPACQEEFRSFQALYPSFGLVPPVDQPEDLSERIARRLDKQDWERGREGPGARWLRLAAYGAAAAAVVVAVVATYGRVWGGGVEAGIGPAPVRAEEVRVELSSGQVRLRFLPGRRCTVTVLSGGSEYSNLPPADAAHSRTDTVEAFQLYNVPLVKNGGHAAQVWVLVEPAGDLVAVFLPADPGPTGKSFKGHLVDALRHVSSRYGVVIEARLRGGAGEVEVDLASPSAAEALDSALGRTGLRWRAEEGLVRIR